MFAVRMGMAASKGISGRERGSFDFQKSQGTCQQDQARSYHAYPSILAEVSCCCSILSNANNYEMMAYSSIKPDTVLIITVCVCCQHGLDSELLLHRVHEAHCWLPELASSDEDPLLFNG